MTDLYIVTAPNFRNYEAIAYWIGITKFLSDVEVYTVEGEESMARNYSIREKYPVGTFTPEDLEEVDIVDSWGIFFYTDETYWEAHRMREHMLENGCHNFVLVGEE